MSSLHAVPARRSPRSHLARQVHHDGAALAVHRSPGRQPGADRPDEPGPQAQDVRAPGPDGLQGDRGRVPGREPDRLRLRPRADRGGPHPGRRPDLGAHPGPGGPDRALGPVAGRRAHGHRAHVQRHRADLPPGGVPHRPRGVQGARRRGHPARDEVRRAVPGRDGLRLRVLARDLHGHRARLRPGRLRGRSWTSGSPARAGRSS